MASVKDWIEAARLRTLPLAISGIIAGGAVAVVDGKIDVKITLLAVLTALLLQVLSNFANDFGDSEKGTDNEHRVGPERTVQSGAISAKQMKSAMVMTSVLALAAGVWLIVEGMLGMPVMGWIVFGLLGVLSIAAAIMYTVGKRPYGYMGLGDLMVFVFFGLVSVLGTAYLNNHMVSWSGVLMAYVVGALSAGVLNLNNMRDAENDKASGKNTLATKLGETGAKRYHFFLIASATLAYAVSLELATDSSLKWLGLAPAILLQKDLLAVFKTKEKAKLDPFLKKLAIGTFLLSVAYLLVVTLIGK